ARQAQPVVAEPRVVDFERDHRLRRPAKVSGLVRLVAIADYDLVACGGTHVRSSAELLPLKLLGREKGKGDLTRVTFIVGAEALADYDLKHAVTTRLSGLLSAPPEELPMRSASLHEQLAESRREVAASQRALAEHEARALLGAADSHSLPGNLLVAEVFEPARAATFSALIDSLQRAERCVSLLAGLTTDGRAKLAFLAGPGADVDLRPALQAALEVLGGRGGGRPDRAQGAGEHGERISEAMAAARSVLISSDS
ncbi:MAG TPA: DHHA1 domain-containing protein, partial [Trueperaceae bacterium]|nr:DHHA1 domain-containing protein [Trueperaceae bacterium]